MQQLSASHDRAEARRRLERLSRAETGPVEPAVEVCGTTQEPRSEAMGGAIQRLPEDFMLVLDSNIKKRLAGVVNGMTSDPDLREDLMQEAMVHFWQAEHQRPGQQPSWYLQSCSFHLRHLLGSGRSIDSSRRGRMRVVRSAGEDEDGGLDLGRTEDPVLDQVSAREILRLLPPLLNRREQAVLKCLAEGLRPGEIVHRLCLSHPTVNKCRRRIAAIAGRLGLMAMPNYANCRLGNGRSQFHLARSFPEASPATSRQRAISRSA